MAKKKPTESGEKLLSIAEAAKHLGVTRQTIHAAIKRKQLKATKGKFTVQKFVTVTRRGWCVALAALEAYKISTHHQEAGKKN